MNEKGKATEKAKRTQCQTTTTLRKGMPKGTHWVGRSKSVEVLDTDTRKTIIERSSALLQIEKISLGKDFDILRW